MPELPDIEVFAYNLKQKYAGKKLLKINAVTTKKLQDTQAQLSHVLEGQILGDVYRSGKELRFLFGKDVLLGMHLMLTGDLHEVEQENKYKSTIVEMWFQGGKGLVLTDRMKNANIRLHPRDKAGVDALSRQLNYAYLKEAFNRKTAVKNILLNQDVIRGIGNGYSDEILWQARISPFSTASAIPAEKIKELPRIIKKVLKEATKKILKNYPGLVTGEVKDYLLIHHKKKTHSPSGFPILVEEKSGRRTHYTEEQILYK